MLDSKSWIPTALCVFSLLWLLAIIIVNDPERDKEIRRRKNEDEDNEDIA
jgi:hypothetical protein